MHEMGIALEIIDIAKASVPEDLRGAPIARINLRIGKLAGVVAESLRFCFQIAVQDTALRDTELSIESVPVMAACRQCEHGWEVDEPAFACPNCAGTRIELISGREMDVESIEMEEP